MIKSVNMGKLEPRGKQQFQTEKIFHPSQANHLRFSPSKITMTRLFANLSGAKHFFSIKANVLTHTHRAPPSPKQLPLPDSARSSLGLFNIPPPQVLLYVFVCCANVITITFSFKTLSKFTTPSGRASTNDIFQAFLEASVPMAHFAWKVRSQFQVQINCYNPYTAKTSDVDLSFRAPRAVAAASRTWGSSSPDHSKSCAEPLFRAGCQYCHQLQSHVPIVGTVQ